jgi:hypothetical protein
MDRWDHSDPTQFAQDGLGGHETRRANAALRDYLLLGPGRSLEKLQTRYGAIPKARTRHISTLRVWARRYDWQARAECFDELEQVRAEAEEFERQSQMMQTGLVLSSARVENLKQLYSELQEYLKQGWPVWLADLQAASGDSPAAGAGRASRFSTSIIAQMRGILDDLARETGGRAQRRLPAASAAPNLDPDEAALPDLSRLSQEDLDALEKIMQKAAPGSTPEINLRGRAGRQPVSRVSADDN